MAIDPIAGEDQEEEDAPGAIQPPLFSDIVESDFYGEADRGGRRQIIQLYSAKQIGFMRSQGASSDDLLEFQTVMQDIYKENDADFISLDTAKQIGVSLTEVVPALATTAIAVAESFPPLENLRTIASKAGINIPSFSEKIQFKDRVFDAETRYFQGLSSIFKDKDPMDGSFSSLLNDTVSGNILFPEEVEVRSEQILRMAAEHNGDDPEEYLKDESRNMGSLENARLLMLYKSTLDPQVRKQLKINMTKPSLIKDADEELEKFDEALKKNIANTGLSEDFAINVVTMAADPLEIGFTIGEIGLAGVTGGASLPVTRTARGAKIVRKVRKAIGKPGVKIALGSVSEAAQEGIQSVLLDPEATPRERMMAMFQGGVAGGVVTGTAVGVSAIADRAGIEAVVDSQAPVIEAEEVAIEEAAKPAPQAIEKVDEPAEEAEALEIQEIEAVTDEVTQEAPKKEPQPIRKVEKEEEVVEPAPEPIQKVETLEAPSAPETLAPELEARVERAKAKKPEIVEEVEKLKAEQEISDNDVVVVDTVEDLPAGPARDQAIKAAESGSLVEGVWIPEEQKVYMVASDLNEAVNPDGTKRTVQQVFAHEVVGHQGMKPVLGENFDGFMSNVWNDHKQSETMAPILEARKDVDVGTEAGQIELAEEFVAKLAESPQLAPTLWRKVIDSIKKWAGQSVTESDIRRMLIKSRDALKARAADKGRIKKVEPVEAKKAKPPAIVKETPKGPARFSIKKKTGRGKFAIRVTEDERLSAQMKEANIPIEYDIVGNEEVLKQANEFLAEARTIANAIERIKIDKSINPNVRIAASEILILRSDALGQLKERQGKQQEANDLYDLSIDISNHTVEFGRELGRGIQQFTTWARMSPSGFLRLAFKQIEKMALNAQEKVKDEVKAVVDGIKKAEETAGEKTSKHRRVVDATIKIKSGKVVDADGKTGKVQAVKSQEKSEADSKPRTAKKSKTGKTIWGQYTEAGAKSLIGLIEKAFAGKPRLEVPALQEFTQSAVKLLRQRIGEQMATEQKVPVESISDIELLKNAVNNWGQHQQIWEELQQQAYDKHKNDQKAMIALSELFGTITVNPVTGKVIQGVTQSEIKDMSIVVNELVRDHAKAQNRTREFFRKRIRDKLSGLSEVETDYLTDVIIEEYDLISEKERTKILNGIIARGDNKQKKVARAAKDNIDKIIELSNLGGLTNAAVFNAVGEQLGFPSFTPEFGRKINKMAQEIQAAPLGFQRDNLTTDLMNEIYIQSGVTKVNLMASIYYANMLSGYRTQEVNAIAGFMNVLVNMAAITVTRGFTNLPTVLNGAMHGAINGFIEGANIIRTGRSRIPQFTAKLGADPVLEIIQVKSFAGIPLPKKLNPINYLKFVFRAMSAFDAFNRLTAQEMKARTLARDIAKREGLRGKKLSQRINELLFNNEKQTKQAEAIADEEGMKGADRSRRIAEIKEQKREQAIQEDAFKFGGHVSFNHDPYGMLGWVSTSADGFFKSGIAKAEKAGNFRVAGTINFARLAVIPFTRIVGNVVNQSVDMTPAGYRHVFLPENDFIGGEIFRSDSFKSDAIGRATIGIMTTAAFATLALQYEDDEDPSFWIYGRGPLNRDDKNLLRETGWKPYSMKVGNTFFQFKETVFGINFGILGNYLDSFRFKSREKDDNLTRLTAAGLEAFPASFDQSFLKGGADLMDILRGKGGNTDKKITQLLSRMAITQAIPFNSMFRQVDQLFDPSLYEQNDIKSIILDQVPVVRREGKPVLNRFGKPVKLSRGGTMERMFSRFVSTKVNDPVIDFLTENNLESRLPGKRTYLKDTPMTGDEWYEYVRMSGRKIYDRIRKDLRAGKFKNLSNEKMQKRIRSIEKSEETRAKNILRKRFR